MKEKIKIFVIADHPFSPSGVGVQTRYMIEPLLKTGKFSFICFGGAIKHKDYSPQKLDQWGDDLVIYPVDGYGTQEAVRSIIRTERPDMLWFMTDPRFFPWLWEIEDEIRSLIPMVYYHVWDNYPYPDFNKIWYDSCDVVACISKLTYDIVQKVAPDVESHYLPHTVNTNHFKPIDRDQKRELRNKMGVSEDKFVVFWNNRNARRKHPGTLIFWFKEFLDRVGHENAKLVMHTDPNDTNGPNLISIINKLGLENGEVQFSTQKVDFPELAAIYNASDVTVNISDAEGFGLATLESLFCGTPVIVNMTGGLQEQVTDGENWFGVGLEPTAKAVIGSQDIPYIYEDRVSKEDFISALEKLYNMSHAERDEMAKLGLAHVQENYGFDKYSEKWQSLLTEIHEKYGSWETRTGYKTWQLEEL
tara:strand:- start:67489 stop:68742 length:1254 start_codon:yes stop_codon:yes gene_type:complete